VSYFNSIRDPLARRCSTWIAHDGTRVPVLPESRPGVAFRNGWRVEPEQYRASHWVDFWQHADRPMDIIAYLPSPGARATTQARSAVRALISARYRSGTTEWIDDALADDLIALLDWQRVQLRRPFGGRAGR